MEKFANNKKEKVTSKLPPYIMAILMFFAVNGVEAQTTPNNPTEAIKEYNSFRKENPYTAIPYQLVVIITEAGAKIKKYNQNYIEGGNDNDFWETFIIEGDNTTLEVARRTATLDDGTENTMIAFRDSQNRIFGVIRGVDELQIDLIYKYLAMAASGEMTMEEFKRMFVINETLNGVDLEIGDSEYLQKLVGRMIEQASE